MQYDLELGKSEDDRGGMRSRGLLASGLLACGLLAGGCGGEPPRELAGFALGMSQAEVAARARELGGFTCRYRGTTPPTMSCEGGTDAGPVTVRVRSDAVRVVALELDTGGEDPQRAVRRFVRGFGDPAWREKPLGGSAAAGSPAQAYHTLWVGEDSTRAVAAICAGRDLEPPCTIQLETTSPAGVVAKLDSLLGIAGRRRR